MAKLTVKIQMDNKAFHDRPLNLEFARMLCQLADHFETFGGPYGNIAIFDSDGNRVGFARLRHAPNTVAQAIRAADTHEQRRGVAA